MQSIIGISIIGISIIEYTPTSVRSASRFDDRNQVAGNSDDAPALETCLSQQLSPFEGAALLAAGNSQHVQVAHNAILQCRIGNIDDIRQNEFDHQDATPSRQNRTAAVQYPDGNSVLVSVQ